MRRGENWRTQRKTSQSRVKSQQQTLPTYGHESGIKPGPHWWVASAITTTPPLLSVEFEYHLLARCSVHRKSRIITIINLLLTECEGHTGECWPEVVADDRGPIFPSTAQANSVVSSLLYGFLITFCFVFASP